MLLFKFYDFRLKCQTDTIAVSLTKCFHQGNIDVTSTSIAIPKKLFEQPTSILFKNAPSCIDPYMVCTQLSFRIKNTNI